ncbi:MAG: magnesium and cobalt transport protein CorA [Fluviicola sp.]|nr:MAG: magnesium and cobalt transport protein CorA [Fluviicola sp.]
MGKRKHHTKKSKLGMAPGSLLFTGEQKMEQVNIEVMKYDEKSIEEKSFSDISKAIDFVDSSDKVSWINIEGIHDVETIEKVMLHFNLHRLTGEDILSVGQRPKLDDYSNYLHVVLRMFMLVENEIEDEQITLVLTQKCLVTFQEKPGDVFNFVRRRLNEGKGQIRTRGADYLHYALIDSVVDHYFIILENFGDKIEDLEIELLDRPTDDVLKRLHHLRREALQLRRNVYPLREVVSRLEKQEADFINPETRLFVRDLYDHTIQVIETVEVFRDSASGLLDLYMNSISNKMNGIMKLLTIVSTIFIPLTFIAGVYGMNFQHMPELEYRFGYGVAMLVMFVIAVIMVIFFKRKKWL